MVIGHAHIQDWFDAVRQLRDLADMTRVRAVGPSGWLRAASALAAGDPGILATLGPNKLSSLDGQAVRSDAMIDGPALIASAVAVAAARHRQLLPIAVAPGARHLPLFIAAIAILGDTIRDRFMTPARGNGTLIVSSDLDLRAKYATLQIAGASIDAVHPGSRLNARGGLEYLNFALRHADRDPDAKAGVCFMYPASRLPEHVDIAPRYVILDFRCGRESDRSFDIVTWARRFFDSGIIVLYTSGDAWTEHQIGRITRESLSFDHQAIATCEHQLVSVATSPPQTAASHSPLNATFADTLRWLARDNQIKCITYSATLNKLFASIDRTLLGRDDYDDPAIRRARWLYATIRDLAVPIRCYDLAAQNAGKYTLSRMTTGLQVLLRSPTLGPLVQSIAVLLEEAQKRLLVEAPRTAALLTAIEDAVLTHDDVIVLMAKDATGTVALELWLDEVFGSDLQLLARVRSIKIADAWMLQDERIGTMILSGLLPLKHRWLYGANLGASAIHICSSPQADTLRRLLQLPCDPLLLSRSMNSRCATLSAISGRQVSVGGADTTPREIRISGLPPEQPLDTGEAKRGLTVVGKIEQTRPQPKQKLRTLGRGLESLSLLMQAAESDRDDNDQSDMSGKAPGVPSIPDDGFFGDDEPEMFDSPQELFRARRVIGTRDGERVSTFLDDSRPYEVIPLGDATLVDLYSVDLSPGDTLLLTDFVGRLGVFDQMLSIIERRPQFESLASYRRAWRAAVRRLRDAGTEFGRLDCRALLMQLQRCGADIESDLTVRNWIDGSVIGPAKVGSIRAVGSLIGSTDMVERAGEYDRAFRSIRTIHQALGRQISNILRGVKEDFATAGDGEPYAGDASITLPLRDLMQSIVPIVVEHVDEGTTSIPVTSLHHLRRASL